VAGIAPACRCASSDPTPQPTQKHPAVDAPEAAASASTSAVTAPAASSVAPVASALTPRAAGATDVVAAFDGHEVRLRWGIAHNGAHGVAVELLSQPFDCSKMGVVSAIPSSYAGARASFEVPSGPGGRFYAGHRVGVSVMLDDSTRSEPGMPALSSLSMARSMSASSVAVTLEAFRFERGAHARGRIDGAETMLIGSASAHGDFDVEVCVAPEPSSTEALREAVPPGPVRGRIGAKAVAPGTALAVLQRRPTSRDEAIDQAIGRSTGGLAAIWEIEFYAAVGVHCPDPKKPARSGALFHVQSIGGAAVDHDFAGTQQPATAVLHAPGDDFAGVWPAWIDLDAITLSPGGRVSGVLWAQSAAGEYREDKKGALGGRFEALVCEQ
jgi:hypothetical protein